MDGDLAFGADGDLAFGVDSDLAFGLPADATEPSFPLRLLRDPCSAIAADPFLTTLLLTPEDSTVASSGCDDCTPSIGTFPC